MTWSEYFDFDKEETEKKWPLLTPPVHLPKSLDTAVKSTKAFLANIDKLKRVYVCLLTRSAVEPEMVGEKKFLKVTNSSDTSRGLGFRGLDTLTVAEAYAHSVTESLGGNRFRTFRCFTDYFNGGSFVLRRCDNRCASLDGGQEGSENRLCIKRYGKLPECLFVHEKNDQKTLDETAIAYFLACKTKAKEKEEDHHITLVAVGATDNHKFPFGEQTAITACYVVFSTEVLFDFSFGDWLVGGLINSVLEALLRGHQDVLEHNQQWRRSALRSAVSAIMGRNMSHNIGSHVLARYGSVIRDDLIPAEKGHTDHRADFLSYLQRRMDLLAEMATSGQAHWWQNLSLAEQISRLNYQAQQERFRQNPKSACYKEKKEEQETSSEPPAGAGAGCLECAANMRRHKGHGKPILLTYITGKESLLASVEYGMPMQCITPIEGCCEHRYVADVKGMEDLRFSCPGGEVGVHALYIILENVIRNSARHGSTTRRFVQLFVMAVKDKDGEDIQLKIIDPGSLLEQHDAKEESLPEKINRILCESLLDDYGLPAPGNWGVREMQICAQYLAGLPLSDLESIAKPVLEAGVYPLPDNQYCLQYAINLCKPRNAVIVRKEVRSDGGHEMEGITEIAESDPELLSRIRGYEFIVVEDVVVGAPCSNFDLVAPVRRIPCGEKEIDDILRIAEPDRILAELHARLADFYTKKDKRKERYGTEKPIVSVVGWDPGQVNQTCVIGMGSTQLNGRSHHHIQTWLGKPLVDFPVGFSFHSAPSEWMGVAWLDHAKNGSYQLDDFGNPRSPFFGGAGVPCRQGGETVVRPWLSVEPCWSDSPQTQILAAIRKMYEENDGPAPEMEQHATLLQELICAAIPRIIVLDERVQSRRKDKVRDVSLYKYWPMVGIWTPFKKEDLKDTGFEKTFLKALSTPYCDLDQPIFKKIRAFLKKPSPLAHQGNADFLVVHLTVLEKLKAERREDKDVNCTLSALVKGTKAADAVKVVVTGRGVPNHHGLSLGNGEHRHYRLVPISALLEYLVTRPSKLGLMRVLWSA